MFASIEGKVIHANGCDLIIEIQSGLGLEVKSLVKAEKKMIIKLFLTHIFRENSQELYGFGHYEEKQLFELLLKVKGVGPKIAFHILEILGIKGLYSAVANQDKNKLKTVPGIGNKLSELMLLELKNRLKDILQFNNLNSSPVLNEAIEALLSLGSKETEILPIAEKLINHGTYISSVDLVRDVLQKIGENHA